MLDASMDAHDWPGGDEDDDGACRKAFEALFLALLDAGYDEDTVIVVMASPAAFLGVEFVPMEMH